MTALPKGVGTYERLKIRVQTKSATMHSRLTYATGEMWRLSNVGCERGDSVESIPTPGGP